MLQYMESSATSHIMVAQTKPKIPYLKISPPLILLFLPLYVYLLYIMERNKMSFKNIAEIQKIELGSNTFV